MSMNEWHCYTWYSQLSHYTYIGIDECEMEPCSVYANCFSTDGSYHCICKEGFIGDGFDCEGKQLVCIMYKAIVMYVQRAN